MRGPSLVRVSLMLWLAEARTSFFCRKTPVSPSAASLTLTQLKAASLLSSVRFVCISSYLARRRSSGLHSHKPPADDDTTFQGFLVR